MFDDRSPVYPAHRGGVRDTLDVAGGDRVGRVLDLAAAVRAGFDREYAGKLLDPFGVDPRAGLRPVPAASR